MTDKNEAIRLLTLIAQQQAIIVTLLQRPDAAQVRDFAHSERLGDRVNQFLEWCEETNWTLGGKPIASWRAAYRSYVAARPRVEVKTSLMTEAERKYQASELVRAAKIKAARKTANSSD